MDNIHIIMGFNRPHMVDIYTEFFRPHDIILHPIMRDNIVDWPKEKWIQPIESPIRPKEIMDGLYFKFNYFIKTQPINDEDYYMFLCDDDSIEGDVFDEIRKMNDDVIFISMRRGHNINYERPSNTWHGTNTFYAKPEFVLACNISLQQFFVKGKVLKQVRFRDHNWADGYMCEYLKEHYTPAYREDLFSLFNFYEPGRWNSPEALVTGVVVSYNTKELLQTAIESIRRFHPTMKFIIVDNSDKKDSCYSYVEFLSSETIKVIHTGKNLGHGRGIVEGIKHVETPYMLLFDSDIVMRKTCVQDMIDMMEPEIYGAGWIQKTDIGGHIYETRKNMTIYGPMRYLHPFFCLIQLSEYRKYPPFIHHGSPAVNTMYAIHKEGSSIQKVKSLDNIFDKYITHDFEGTRKICGIGGGAVWDCADGDLDAKNGKALSSLNGITCICCTGDRPEAFELCQNWIASQTVRPEQFIVVDDGKIPTTPKINCEYVRREPQRNDPLHTMTMNLKLALSKVTGDKIIIWEDDDYYSPKYIEEMSKKLDEYDLVGIGKSKYYNIQAFRYYQHNGEAFKDHASLAQTAFKKSLIPLILKKMNGDQFLDVRIWQGLRGNSNIFVDDKESLYVGIKGMPGRKGIGSGHNPNMEGYKDDKNKAVLRAWIQEKKHLEQYLNLKTEGKERSVSVRTYKAIKNGGYIPANSAYKSSVYGRINPGTVFEYEGPVGMWMSPIDEPEKKMVPVEDLPIYVKAKEISESKGLPSLEQTPLDSKPKLKGKRR